MRQDALRRVEMRKEISLRKKLKEQKERDERLRFPQLKEKLKRQIQKEELEKKTRDERIAQLLRENETLIRQVEKDRENTPPPSPPAARPKEKSERDTQVKQEHETDRFETRERESALEDKYYNTSSHVSDGPHIKREEIEFLRNRLDSLEKSLQDREDSGDQYTSGPSPTGELERKERYLKNLRDLNKKEEEIGAQLNLDKPKEVQKKIV